MEYARAAPDLGARSCFLGDWRDDQEQYQALMDSGLTFAKAYNLRPGIALTANQLALLTTDIVWLQQETVTLADGTQTQTQVLVPHVYAAVKAGDLTPAGALLSGDSVAIQTTGDITNAGTILGRKVVQIDAGNILHIVCADLSVLSEQVLRRITRIQGVGSIRSNIVLNCIKSSTELPLGHLGR